MPHSIKANSGYLDRFLGGVRLSLSLSRFRSGEALRLTGEEALRLAGEDRLRSGEGLRFCGEDLLRSRSLVSLADLLSLDLQCGES